MKLKSLSIVFSFILVTSLLPLFTISLPAAAEDPSTEWITLFGTSGTEIAFGGIAVDSTGIYVAGGTSGESPRIYDALIAKFGFQGNQEWVRQFIIPGNINYITDIAVDATGIYAIGNAGDSDNCFDCFLRKFNPDGTDNWTCLFGTDKADYPRALSIDETGIYIAGSTKGAFPIPDLVKNDSSEDAFVLKFDKNDADDKNPVWIRQFGQAEAVTCAYGISAGSNGVYVAGYTSGNLTEKPNAGMYDAFIRKFDAEGTASWIQQFGTADNENVQAMSVDPTGIYVTGSLNPASTEYTDVFVYKYDHYGEPLGYGTFGSYDIADIDIANDMASQYPKVYLAGRTDGTLSGETCYSNGDAFVCEIDAEYSDGEASWNVNRSWTSQFGTDAKDEVKGISVSPYGIFAMGITQGEFTGQSNAGGQDIFIAKISSGNCNLQAVAEAGPDQTALVGEQIGLDAGNSYDPDGTIVAYEWDFGDAATGTGVTPFHVYSYPGTYTVKLTVTDNQGSSNTDTASITVLTQTEAVQEVVTEINGLDINSGIKNSLTSKLDEALKSLDKGNIEPAINILEAFINAVEAQRGKALTEAEADGLIAAAIWLLSSL